MCWLKVCQRGTKTSGALCVLGRMLRSAPSQSGQAVIAQIAKYGQATDADDGSFSIRELKRRSREQARRFMFLRSTLQVAQNYFLFHPDRPESFTGQQSGQLSEAGCTTSSVVRPQPRVSKSHVLAEVAAGPHTRKLFCFGGMLGPMNEHGEFQ